VGSERSPCYLKLKRTVTQLCLNWIFFDKAVKRTCLIDTGMFIDEQKFSDVIYIEMTYLNPQINT